MRTLTLAATLSIVIIAFAALALVLVTPEAGAGPVPLVVTTTDDLGDGTCDESCTLRDAITAANLSPGNSIHFDIPGCPADCTISLESVLPGVLQDGTTIDGTTEPDYNGAPIIILDGSSAGFADGISLGANDTTVRGLIIQNFSGSGIAAGTSPGYDNRAVEDSILRNNGTYGIAINGSDASVLRNVVEGNGSDGISSAFAEAGTGSVIDSNEVTGNAGNGIRSGISDSIITNNVVTGNGFDGIQAGDGVVVATGNTVSDNGSAGLFVTGDESTITDNIATENGETGIIVGGGPATVRDNVSNDNGFAFQNAVAPAGIDPGFGMEIGGGDASGKIVTANSISGNASHGIAIFNGGNTIGSSNAEDANQISGNGGAGIYVEGDDATGNRLLRNSIFDNDGLGIDLEPVGLNANDPLDGDTGANNGQNFPDLTVAQTGSLQITGTLNTEPLTQYQINFFHNDACDPTGYGEGKTFIGSVDVTTDDAGNAVIDTDVDSAPATGFVTSTATNDTSGNTSEFSNCVLIQGIATPTSTPSPTATAGPTATATPVPSDSTTPTSTPTPTVAPADFLWGDIDCSGSVGPVDSLKVLRHDAGLSVAQADECPPVAEPYPVDGGEELWGDIDCSEAVDPVDSLKTLRFDAGLSVAQDAGCPEVGEPA